jgi:dienelactone hydrolase
MPNGPIVSYWFQLWFAGTYHGFAIRGDTNSEVIQKAKEEAFQDTLQFFNEHL